MRSPRIGKIDMCVANAVPLLNGAVLNKEIKSVAMLETSVAARSKLKQKIARFIARLKNQPRRNVDLKYFCDPQKLHQSSFRTTQLCESRDRAFCRHEWNDQRATGGTRSMSRSRIPAR